MKTPVLVSSDVKLGMQALLNVYAHGKKRCVLVGESACRPLARSALCKGFTELRLDGVDDARLAVAINTACQQALDPVILPTDVRAARAVLRLSRVLRARSIPLPTAAQFDILDDKWHFYQFCRQHGFAVPDSRLARSKHEIDFDRVVAALGLPFVLKPPGESGSRGVHVIHDKAYFEREIIADPAYNFGPLVLQRYVEGEDGGLSLFAIDGKLRAFAIQIYVKDGIRFIPDGALEHIAQRFTETTSFNGLVNLDVRFESGTGKRWLLEANPRLWSSIFACTWCGVNMVALSMEDDGGGSAVRGLTSGRFQDRRHPLVWPPSWPYLLSGHGYRGRISRAMTFDHYILPLFLSTLPARVAGFARRQFANTGPVTRPRM
jgi:hypothetical protein